jgi:nucleoside-diphosphate-sugar epimerase
LALDAGYRVRGTVRDPKNEKKTQYLRTLPGAAERLELVALDLEKSDQSVFDKAAEGCTLIAHTASPLPAHSPKDENELIKPAVQGTLAVLKAALKSSTVKKVVVTSSVAAVGPSEEDPNEVRGEKCWTDLKTASAYPKSKTLAEKAAWDFYNENKPSWSLSTVNPAFVIGPYIGPEKSASAEVGIRLLNASMPMVPKVSFGFVDVRDVAAAHIKVLQADPSVVNGRRFILTRENKWMAELAATLDGIFKPLGYKVPAREVRCPWLCANSMN